MELMARLYYAFRVQTHTKYTLTPWKTWDKNISNHYKLTPNHKVSHKDLYEDAVKHNRLIRLKQLNNFKRFSNYASIDYHKINSSGFKGPEIDKVKTRFRVLTIGDSCTY